MQEQNTKPNFEKDIELTNESSNSNTSYADNAELAEQEQTATANTDINNASVRDTNNILSGSDVTINNQESQQTEMVQLEDSKTLADKTDSNTKVNSLDADNNLSDNTADRNTSNTKEQNNTTVKALDNTTAVTNNTLESNNNTLGNNNSLDANKSLDVNTLDSSNTGIENTDNVLDVDNTSDALDANTDKDRKLTNIEKYNQSLNAEERRANSRQAGIRSGEARRERRTLGEHLKALLSVGDTQEEICLGIIEQAKKGNYKAFNSIRDTIGEMPTVKQEITADVTTDADRQLMDKIANRLNVTEK